MCVRWRRCCTILYDTVRVLTAIPLLTSHSPPATLFPALPLEEDAGLLFLRRRVAPSFVSFFAFPFFTFPLDDFFFTRFTATRVRLRPPSTPASLAAVPLAPLSAGADKAADAGAGGGGAMGAANST